MMEQRTTCDELNHAMLKDYGILAGTSIRGQNSRARNRCLYIKPRTLTMRAGKQYGRDYPRNPWHYDH